METTGNGWIAVDDLGQVRPGQRVRVVQTIDRREGDWTTTVEGIVQAVEAQPTVSWYAHQKHGRLWLQRLYLRKPDGEVSALTLDPYSQIQVLDSPKTAS